MSRTGFFYRLVFFGFTILLPVFFFGTASADQSSFTVTQEVIDNSGGGGGGGGGGGSSGATGAAAASAPAPAPAPATEISPAPEVAPAPAPAPVPVPTPEAPSAPVSVSAPSASPSVGTGASSGQGGASGAGGGGGGFVQTLSSIAQNVSNTLQLAAQGGKFVAQAVSKVGTVVVENTQRIVKSPVGKATAKLAEPIGVISGGVAVGSQVLVSTMTVTSFSDVYLLIIKMFGLLVGLFRKRRKPWGTVYDSVTKRPLDPAYVVIKKESGDEIADAITDLDGRFGFFVPGGRYNLDASKTNYAFPSKILSGKQQDELYENLYHGDSVESREGEVIIRNIPLDPVNFDWNEFEKNKQQLFRLYSDKERKWKRAFDYIYNFGFLAALLTAVLDGNYFNYSFLAFYLVIMLYQTFFIWRRTAVNLKYAGSGEPIPYSIIRLFSPEADNEVKSVVTDHLGRFYLLVGPGKYYLTVDAKQPDASYKRVYRSEVMDLKNGIVPSDVIVPGVSKDYESQNQAPQN